VLTVDFDLLGVGPNSSVLDVGCGAGRHAFAAYRRGADVVALDHDAGEIGDVATLFEAMADAGEAPSTARAEAVVGDALALPYPDNTFDCVIASEILEHVVCDDAAIAELVRVVKVGGCLVVTVPRWLPEQVCWMLSREYHSNDGGHVRIYRASALRDEIIAGGMRLAHRHHAHGLHAPFWWLRCLVGVSQSDHPAVAAYHKMLVWDMMARPWATRAAEAVLNPLIGKSVAMYFEKPAGRHALV
jgi:SAM-dependent methyltransferase